MKNYILIAMTIILLFCFDSHASNEQKWAIIKAVPTPVVIEQEASVRTIYSVHASTKADFKYIPDVVDTWKTPKEFIKDHGGDCEDFAIYMAFELMKRGFKRSDMKLMLGYDYNNEAHATLLISTPDGDMISDVRSILPISKREYMRTWHFKEVGTYQF